MFWKFSWEFSSSGKLWSIPSLVLRRSSPGWAVRSDFIVSEYFSQFDLSGPWSPSSLTVLSFRVQSATPILIRHSWPSKKQWRFVIILDFPCNLWSESESKKQLRSIVLKHVFYDRGIITPIVTIAAGSPGVFWNRITTCFLYFGCLWSVFQTVFSKMMGIHSWVQTIPWGFLHGTHDEGGTTKHNWTARCQYNVTRFFVCGISLTSGQLVSQLFPDCTRSCFSQVVLRRRGGDRIYEMRCLFVAVGPNDRLIVLPHWDNMS